MNRSVISAQGWQSGRPCALPWSNPPWSHSITMDRTHRRFAYRAGRAFGTEHRLDKSYGAHAGRVGDGWLARIGRAYAAVRYGETPVM